MKKISLILLFFLLTAVSVYADEKSCISKDGQYYTIVKQENDGSWYIYTETKDYGPFIKEPDFVMRKENGSICFCIYENETSSRYVYTDGKKSGPYSFVFGNPFTISAKKFIYSYTDSETCKSHLCIDGKISAPYDSMCVCVLSDDLILWTKTEHTAQNKEKTTLMYNEKEIYRIDEDSYSYNAHSFPSGMICFSFETKSNSTALLIQNGKIISRADVEKFGDKNFVTYNKKKYGPFDEVDNLHINDNFNCIFSVEKISLEEGPRGISNEHDFDMDIPWEIESPYPPEYYDANGTTPPHYADGEFEYFMTITEQVIHCINKDGTERTLPVSPNSLLMSIICNDEKIVYSEFDNEIFINGEKRVFPDYTSAYLIGFTKDGSILLVLSNSQEAERVILRNDTVYKISEK